MPGDLSQNECRTNFDRFVEQQEFDPVFKAKLDEAREHFREEAKREFGDDDDGCAGVTADV